MNDNSFGSEALKSRSINVGANLLGEWIEEKARFRREILRNAALASVALAVGASILPICVRSTTVASGQARELRKGVADLDAALAVSDKARKDAQPAQTVGSMRDRTQASFDRLMDEVNRTFGAGNARVALSLVHLDVLNGEIHVAVQAEAEEDGAADAFARNAGEEGATVDAITTSKPSALLVPQGMSFHYEKRIGVAR